MPDGQLIEFDHVTKRFGAVAAVADFSARVNPGVVTGFLGPNGAGKTTTLRMLLGLERPTIGTTKIGGKRFSELRHPARVIGAMLENPGFRARRTVERHLIAAAKSNGVELSRVGELISFVGLSDDVDTRISALSLGMRQRLSAATALIGDPGVLVLDEPANGLDPEGIRWMRTLIRGLADEGRTVLVSSHVLSEVEQTADEILVIAHGELKFAGTMEDLADPSSGPVVVDAADRTKLSNALRVGGFNFEVLRSGLTVRGSDAATIGGLTASAGVALTTLQQRGPTLEDVFLDLVNDRYVPAEVPDAGAEVAAVAEVDEPAVEAPEPGTDAEGREVDPEGPEVDPEDPEPDVEAPEPVEGPTTAPVGNISGLFQPVTSSSVTETDEASDGPSDSAEEPQEVSESAEESDLVDAPREPERPLPGIAGLAAVASLFATPAPSNDHPIDADPIDADPIDTDPIDTPVDAAPETEDGESEHTDDHTRDDLDETRVVDVVPTDESSPENETSAEEEFFSSFSDEQPAEHENTEHENPEHEPSGSEHPDSGNSEPAASDGESNDDEASDEADSAHEQH